MPPRRVIQRKVTPRLVAKSNTRRAKDEPQPSKRFPARKVTKVISFSDTDEEEDSSTDSVTESDDEQPLKRKKLNLEMENDETIFIEIEGDEDRHQIQIKKDEDQDIKQIEVKKDEDEQQINEGEDRHQIEIEEKQDREPWMKTSKIWKKQRLEGEIAELEAEKKQLQTKLLHHEKELMDLNVTTRIRDARIKRDWDLLRRTFSAQQVRCFKESKKILHGYSDDDKVIAWTTTNLMFDRRGEEYIKRHMKIPFPARSSVQKWKQDKKTLKPNSQTENDQNDVISIDDDDDSENVDDKTFIIKIKEEP